MREFMTRVSEFINERRNDPERKEGNLAVVILGAVAAVIVVLLLLLLWRYTAQSRDAKPDAGLSAAEGSEKVETYLAESAFDGEELRQEYLTSIAYLGEKVEELLQTMTQVQKELGETTDSYQEKDDVLKGQIVTISKEVDKLVKELKETQVQLQDMTKWVQTAEEKTLPAIQEQISEIQSGMEQVDTDIAALYTKLAALETEDEKLWASIEALEKTARNLMSDVLLYRYEPEENTLYLLPYTAQ